MAPHSMCQQAGGGVQCRVQPVQLQPCAAPCTMRLAVHAVPRLATCQIRPVPHARCHLHLMAQHSQHRVGHCHSSASTRSARVSAGASSSTAATDDHANDAGRSLAAGDQEGELSDAGNRSDEDEQMARMLFVKLSLAASTGRLDLTDCRLTSLPAEVLDLTDLEELSLAGNCLSELPQGIGRLKALKRLGLAGNRLTRLPHSIGELTQLEGLWLHGNLLEDVPQSLAHLTRLTHLSLSGNTLTQLPDIFGGMSQLVDFAAAGNQLTQLPPSLGHLPSLCKLSLNGNALSSLPEDLSGLGVLQELWLQGNALTALPEAIGQLQTLQELSLADNALTSLPPSFASLTSLRKLWAYGNRLSQLPVEALSQLPSLSQLWLEGNPLGAESVTALLQLAAGAAAERARGVEHGRGLKAVGLDTSQLAGAAPGLLKAAGSVLKVGEVAGPWGPGYFKLSPSPLTRAVCQDTGRLMAGPGGTLPHQRLLVVALGSAPGTPNWGGLLGRLYKEAKGNEAEQAFDVLYVVDPHRQWYGSSSEADHAGSTDGSSTAPAGSLAYYCDRLRQYTQQYEKVIMLGDSMGATAALLFAPLATTVLAFTPQVDLATSCMRPGASEAALAQLRARVLGAVAASSARIIALCGTWQHDLDQANLLPAGKVQHKVFSLDSHRLAQYLDSQGKLVPLVQEVVRNELGITGNRNVRVSNLY